MERFHRERVPEDQRTPSARTEIGQPIPGEEAFAAADEIAPVGCHGFEKGVWASRHMPVDKNLAIRVHAAEVQGTGLPIDATVNLMVFRVKAHGGLLLS
jgi:hypothetical protein